MKKILFFCQDFPPAVGGAKTYVYNTVCKLIQLSDFDIHVVTGAMPGYPAKQKETVGRKTFTIHRVLGLQTFCRTGSSLQPLLFQIQALFLRLQPDIIHVINVMPAYLVLRSRKRIGTNIVFTPLNTPWKSNNLYGEINLRRFERFVFSRISKIDIVIAASHHYAGYIKTNIHASYEKLKVIYPGVDIDAYSDVSSKYDVRKKWNISRDDFVLLCPARIDPRKRIEDIVFAMDILHDDRVKVLVTGLRTVLFPAYHAYIETLISDHHLDDRFIRCNRDGLHSDMKGLYRLSDVVILPSEAEGLGMVLLEAMASKRPIIATDIPGVTEVVKNGKNGMLFSVGHVEELVDIIHRIRDQHIDTKKIIDNGFQTANRRFHLQTQTIRLLKLYEQLL